MTNKIIIALAGLLILTIIIPNAYAVRQPTEENWYITCENKLNDEKWQNAEYACFVDIYKMWHNIATLFDITTNIEADLNNTATKISDLQYRLDVLDGTIPAQDLPFTVNVYPTSISKGENFRIYGTANMMVQNWVDFEIHNPTGTHVQYEDFLIEQNNRYSSLSIEPNHRWLTNGTYIVHAYHNNVNATAYIQYNLGQNP